MALHLEDAGLAVADVDDAGVLARPLNDPGRLGRQAAQMQPRRLVGAMLVPHRREDAELGEGRRPADEREDALIFVRLQPMRGDEFGGDWRFFEQRRLLQRHEHPFSRRREKVARRSRVG